MLFQLFPRSMWAAGKKNGHKRQLVYHRNYCPRAIIIMNPAAHTTQLVHDIAQLLSIRLALRDPLEHMIIVTPAVLTL